MKARDVREAVAAANPVRDGDLGDSAQTTEARALLERIVALPRDAQPRQRQVPRRLLLAGAAAASVTATPLVIRSAGNDPSGVAYAVTPPMLDYRPTGKPAAEFLLALAGRIAYRRDDAGSGRYAYAKVQSWTLSTVVDPAARTIATAVIPEVTETWVTGDGSGRIRRTPGAPVSPGPSQSLPPGNKVIELSPAPARSSAVADPPVDLTRLPLEPGALAAALESLPRRLKGPEEPPWLRRYGQILAIWREQPVPARLQAAFLTVIAATPELADLGPVTDRVGRRGHAVCADVAVRGQTVRYVIVLDPQTGRPLGHEEILLGGTSIPELIRPPAVVSYVAYLAAARVPTAGVTP